MNPFRYGCVVAGENFCPRPALQRQLKELVKSGQNVVVQGPRRMGKTSLVCETVRSVRGTKLLYVDLFCVRTVGEFCRRVVVAASKCGSGRTFLDRGDFSDFLASRFAEGERELPREMAECIIDCADGISGDVQELSETTWLETRPGARIGSADVAKGLRAVFAREHRSFAAMKSRLITVQLAVLCGLAEDERAKVFSGAFLEQNGIRNVGSVTKALKRLVDDEYVFEYEGEYRFENPFFRAWLRKT